jgi:exodeoxyribonuclease-3
MLRVTTFNANGIRAAARRGFFTWLRETSPDVLCMQETKAQEHQLPPEALDLELYPAAAFVDAAKKGYSGVAIYAKRVPDRIVRGLGMPDMDAEGRFVRFDWGDLSIASVYVPSGTSGDLRQSVKDSFLERFLTLLADLRHDGRRYIICGDYNVAHTDIDTYDPVRNANVTGFLPHERAWMDAVLDEVGWVDAFREVDRDSRGGPIGRGRSRKTSAGGSTTSSSRPPWRRSSAGLGSNATCVSRTTHRSRSTTIWPGNRNKGRIRL